MKKKIVLLLTLSVAMDSMNMDNQETVKEEVDTIVDGVQRHFNKDLADTHMSATHIETAHVKLLEVVDQTVGEVEMVGRV